MSGVWLLHHHPELATRSCAFCLTTLHGADGKPVETRLHTKEEPDYVQRDDSCPPECRTPKGCPKGTPEESNALNQFNQQAYDHYRECRAVGRFPDDPIVRRNAAIIRDAEDQLDREREQTRYLELVNLLLVAAAKRAT